MMICGNRRVVYSTLAVVSADNLGSLILGGFKESCSAIKMCRHCMATKENTQTKVCNNLSLCVYICDWIYNNRQLYYHHFIYQFVIFQTLLPLCLIRFVPEVGKLAVS